MIDEDLVLVVKGTEFVPGGPDLGEKLMELFFKVLSEGERLPARILFLGTGVFLTTEGSPHLEKLRAFVGKGVDLVSCLTCLGHYDRKDKLVVGRAGDMKNTVDSLLEYRKVIAI